MEIICKAKILMHQSTDSLYYSPTFQKVWHLIDYIYFRSFYTSITNQLPAMIPMMAKEAVVTKCSLLLLWTLPKPSCPKKQLIVGKSLALFKCQLDFIQYIKIKRVCFGIKLNNLTSSSCITLFFSVNSRKRMFPNGNENSDISARERTSFHQLRL